MTVIRFPAPTLFCFCLAVLGSVFLPATAAEKGGMPDLGQVDNTCLPTATANLMIWFGQHGYPNLIPKGGTENERELSLVHRLMDDTNARFDWGTQRASVTTGIEKYIHESGYDGDVEYRGEGGWQAFSQDWLAENDDPNKGFILLLSYGHYNGWALGFSDYEGLGHAVTLVNAQADTLIIHDPDHLENEVGRKIVTVTAPDHSSVLLLTGSLLEAPEDCEVRLSGAVCVVMHPVKAEAPASSTSGDTGDSAARPVAPGSASAGWLMWFLDFFFKK